MARLNGSMEAIKEMVSDWAENNSIVNEFIFKLLVKMVTEHW